MHFESLGGINEHGRNCFLLQGKEEDILLDCGKGEQGEDPDFSALDLSRLRYLFLTHSHLDHIGAVRKLLSLGFEGDIYATKETMDFLPGISIHPLVPGIHYVLNDLLSFQATRSGHCFGGVSYHLLFSGKRILYTGDYQEESVFTIDPIRDEEADLAIVDGAYKESDTLMQNKEKLLAFLLKNPEKPRLFPLPKNGRSMELIALLEKHDIPYDCLEEFYHHEESRYLKYPLQIHSDPKARIKLLLDPQCQRKKTQDIIEAHPEASLILTGTMDQGSKAMWYFSHRPDTHFFRLNVHQSYQEAQALIGQNHFLHAVIFHNRETKEKTSLSF